MGLRPLSPWNSSIKGIERRAPGTSRGVAALLSGCVMDSWVLRSA